MLKASKAQVHIFIQLFSQLPVIFMSNLRSSFHCYQPNLCVIDIKISANNIYFDFSVCHLAFLRVIQTEYTESVVTSNENWNAEHLEQWEENYDSLMCQCFFFMFCTKKWKHI